MKHIKTKPATNIVPRLGSLFHRLQLASRSKELPQPYLDQLMVFLEDPPPDVRDRWKEGTSMCDAWGVPTTGSSVYRLYQAYFLEWRLRLACEADSAVTGSPESLKEKAERMISLRTYETLADPQLAPSCLVGLARIEIRKKALEFARQKHRDNRRRKIERALDALSLDLNRNPAALAAFENLKAVLWSEEDNLPNLSRP
jgi:hypothetical protein